MRTLIRFLTGLMSVESASAVGLGNYGFNCNGFLYCNQSGDLVGTLTGRIIAAISLTITAVATISFMYGAVRLIISRGEEGKEIGKKTILYSLLGLAAGLLTWPSIHFVCDKMYQLGGGVCPLP